VAECDLLDLRCQGELKVQILDDKLFEPFFLELFFQIWLVYVVDDDHVEVRVDGHLLVVNHC